MRKLVSFFVYALDGAVDNPQNWVFDRYNAEVLDFLAATIAEQDAVLLGRATYEAWSSFWPTSTDQPFADFINTTPKYVASTTLTELTWQNSTLLTGDLTEEITRLKAQPGKDIGVHGSATLVQSLLRENLLDELRLALFPAAAGTDAGQHLFEANRSPIRLSLAAVQQTSTGVLLLTYRTR